MKVSIATAYLPPEELGPIARLADEIGYHGLALSDHVINLESLDTSQRASSGPARNGAPS